MKFVIWDSEKHESESQLLHRCRHKQGERLPLQ